MRTIEPVFESPVGPTGEQTAKTLRPSVPQTPETPAVPMPPEAARVTEPSDEEIRLRAYFISEHRRRFALLGDVDSDWREAKQQLLSESGELSRLCTITTEEPSEIPARTEEIALLPTAPVDKPRATAVARPQPSGTMQTSVQLTFSFQIAAVQLTSTFKIGVLQLRPTSRIVTMRLAPSQRAQLEVSFEITKIQPVGETLGTIRVTPSQQQRPIKGSPSFMAAGLQLVPNVEATRVQFMPSRQRQAAVFVTVPCQITTIELSPLLEIASVVLNSSSKQALVQLAGAGPSPADRPLVFEIARLQLSEGGNAGLIQLNLPSQSPPKTLRD
jgi:hypothetical protein